MTLYIRVDSKGNIWGVSEEYKPDTIEIKGASYDLLATPERFQYIDNQIKEKDDN